MKKIHFNESGEIAGRYDTGIHSSIPDAAVEVTAALFNKTIAESDGVWKRDLLTGEIAKHALGPKTIDELIAARLADINSECEAAIATISAGYPASEVASWSKQEIEARAYVADALASVPLLAALATARGVGLGDLATRVIAKADMFAAISGQLIGKRQGLEDVLDVLRDDPDASAADVEAVQW